MRRDMMETKIELEETVKVHKESVQKQRLVEAEIEVSLCNIRRWCDVHCVPL